MVHPFVLHCLLFVVKLLTKGEKLGRKGVEKLVYVQGVNKFYVKQKTACICKKNAARINSTTSNMTGRIDIKMQLSRLKYYHDQYIKATGTNKKLTSSCGQVDRVSLCYVYVAQYNNYTCKCY